MQTQYRTVAFQNKKKKNELFHCYRLPMNYKCSCFIMLSVCIKKRKGDGQGWNADSFYHIIDPSNFSIVRALTFRFKSELIIHHIQLEQSAWCSLNENCTTFFKIYLLKKLFTFCLFHSLVLFVQKPKLKTKKDFFVLFHFIQFSYKLYFSPNYYNYSQLKA